MTGHLHSLIKKLKQLIRHGNQTYNKIQKQIFKTHLDVKKITNLNFPFDIFMISLRPDSIRLNKILWEYENISPKLSDKVSTLKKILVPYKNMEW